MTPEQRRRELGIGSETTGGTPVPIKFCPQQFIYRPPESEYWRNRDFWSDDEMTYGDDGRPLLVAEAERRGAERLAVDHKRLGKIEALQFVRCHLMANYLCRPDMCRKTMIPNKKCECVEGRMLAQIVQDIDYEMQLTRDQPPTPKL